MLNILWLATQAHRSQVVECSECRIFGMANVQNVECSECRMFGMSNVQNVE